MAPALFHQDVFLYHEPEILNYSKICLEQPLSRFQDRLSLMQVESIAVVFVISRVPFQNGDFSLTKEFTPEGRALFSLKSTPLLHVTWENTASIFVDFPMNVCIFYYAHALLRSGSLAYDVHAKEYCCAQAGQPLVRIYT